MADINTTIKDYRELQAITKILIQNQKDLNIAIKNTKIPGEYKKYKAELEEINGELERTKMQVEETAHTLSVDLGSDGFDVLTGNSQVLTEQLKKMKSVMAELAFAGKADSDTFKDLQLQAIEMQKQVNIVNKSISDMANNDSLGTLSNQFKSLGVSILSLDFTTATRQASALRNTLGAISWSSAISGAKSFGSSILSLGKVLLASPMFIIAGVIIGITAAIYKLLKEAGVLTLVLDGLNKVLEVLMIPLNMLIGGFKSLTDAINLTNNAEQELSRNRAEQAAKEAKMSKDINESLQSDYDKKIYLANKELENIKDTDEGALESRIKTQEKINDLTSAKYEFEEAERKADLKKANADLDEFLTKYDGDIQKAIKKDEAKYDELTTIVYKTKQAYADATWNVEVKAEIEGNAAIKSIRDKASDEELKRIEENKKKQEEYVKFRIMAARKIANMSIDLMDEGVDKELAKTRQRWKEFYEDTKNDATLSQKEKTEILALGEELEGNQLRDIKKKYLEEIDVLIDNARKVRLDKEANEQLVRDKMLKDSQNALEAHYKKINRMSMTSNEKSRQDIMDYYGELTKSIVGMAKSTEEAMTLIAMLNVQMNNELSKVPKDTFISKHVEDLKLLTDILKNSGGEYGTLFSSMSDIIGKAMVDFDTVLNTSFDKTSEKVLAYSQLVGGIMTSVLSAMSQELNDQLNYDVDQLNASISNRFEQLDNQYKNANISQSEYQEAKQRLEIDSNNKENVLRKKAFEEDKKFRIAQATMTMLQGMVGAFAQANATIPPPAGAIIGSILAAAVGTMGGINIAKIQSTQFNSKTSSGGIGGGIGSISTPSNDDMKTPSFNFVGSGNDKNTDDLSSSNGGNGNSGKSNTIDITGKVTVSVNDINDGIVQVKTSDTYNSLLSE